MSEETKVEGPETASEPGGPKTEPEGPKSEPEGPKAEPEGPKAESEGPKAEPEGPKVEPEEPKSESEGSASEEVVRPDSEELQVEQPSAAGSSRSGRAKSSTSGGPRAKPVTAAMLRAAARSPEDVKDLVVAEARAIDARRRKGQPVPERKVKRGSSVFAAARALNAKGQQTAGAKRPRSSASSERPSARAQERAARPSPAVPGAAQASESRRPSPAAAPPAGVAAGAKGCAQQLAPPRAPQKQSAGEAPVPAAAAVAPPPPVALTPQVVVSGRSAWPVALAVLVTGVGLGVLLDRRLRELIPPPSAPATPAVQAPAAPESPEPEVEAPAGSLADLGGGRFVYSRGDDRLVVLRCDPTSGELEVERVYRLEEDVARHLGDDLRRRLHGVYLTDLEQARREALERTRVRLTTLLERASMEVQGVARAEEAAASLARLGGADLLLPLLGPERSRLERRAAAIGLGEAGYLAAAPYLSELLERHATSEALVSRLTRILTQLIGEPLDMGDPRTTAELVRAWVDTHPLEDPFARRE